MITPTLWESMVSLGTLLLVVGVVILLLILCDEGIHGRLFPKKMASLGATLLIVGVLWSGFCIYTETCYEKESREIMGSIKHCDTPYFLPGLSMWATDFDLSHSLYVGGKSRKELHEHVRAVAKSWDDCKSYNPKETKS